MRDSALSLLCWLLSRYGMKLVAAAPKTIPSTVISNVVPLKGLFSSDISLPCLTLVLMPLIGVTRADPTRAGCHPLAIRQPGARLVHG